MQKKEKPNVISEATLIPVSLLIVIIGGVSWLTNLNGKVAANTKQLESLNCTEDGCIRSEIIKQGKALARIQGALNIEIPEDEQ